MRRAALRGPWLALLAVATLGGCLDAVDPYQPGGRPGATVGDTTRLTYGTGEDRSPAWIGNDSLVYSAPGFDPYPNWPGLLLSIPRQGSVAQLFLPLIEQPGDSRHFATPVLSPSGDRVAFMDLENRDSLCTAYDKVVTNAGGLTADPVPPPPVPRLAFGRLVVRARAATGPLPSDPGVTLTFQGVTIAGKFITTDYLPFQRGFAEGGTIAFRPSWSPDGQKLVFSDGLRLLVWTVGQADALPLAGGDGGVSPAWSPRGDQIAFSKPTIVSASTITYVYQQFGATKCTETRRNYVQAASRLLLVPAAGGTARDVGDGEEPAWSPDGSTIYARSWVGDLYHMPAAGGAPVTIPGLHNANDLALSPDGNWVAFTRAATSGGNHDVWVVRLSH